MPPPIAGGCGRDAFGEGLLGWCEGTLGELGPEGGGVMLAVHLPSKVRLVNGHIFVPLLNVFRDCCQFFTNFESSVAIFDVSNHCVCAEEKKQLAHMATVWGSPNRPPSTRDFDDLGEGRFQGGRHKKD